MGGGGLLAGGRTTGVDRRGQRGRTTQPLPARVQARCASALDAKPLTWRRVMLPLRAKLGVPPTRAPTRDHRLRALPSLAKAPSWTRYAPPLAFGWAARSGAGFAAGARVGAVAGRVGRSTGAGGWRGSAR